ncbi:hypothetical protein PRNP1_011578 [Phytophthora ramorum]
MAKLSATFAFAAALALAATAVDPIAASQLDSNVGSSASGSDIAVEIPGYQVADVSGEQACGGVGFDYSRYWAGPLPDGAATKLNCVSGYRCEAKGSSPIFWCKQFALPLNAKCGGYRFYTLFKCVEGTACKIDPSRFEPRCLPMNAA